MLGLRDVLDDDPSSFTLGRWRSRNVALYDALRERGLVDPAIVSPEAHRYINTHLIHHRVGACVDPQNAGHVRAQNVNIVHYALSVGAPAEAVTIALQAGFVHDLNKAFGEPLRTDEYGPRNRYGRPLRSMTTIAQIVGLNHLGERTRRVLERATRLDKGALSPEVARAVDQTIAHHGLGSSQFIRSLVDGDNPWWGHEFVDPETGVRRIVHPPPPPMTLSTVLHDLADSTQQMQGGVAWLMKYPAGYWRAEGRGYAAMLSDRTPDAGIAMSLAKQIREETETSVGIIAEARAKGILTSAQGDALRQALVTATQPSIDWVTDEAGVLEDVDGRTAYHDVGQRMGISAVEAQERLRLAVPGTHEGDQIEEALWASGRRLDLEWVEFVAGSLVG